jgi:hypothetical protein
MPKNKGSLLLTPAQLVKAIQKPKKTIDKNQKKATPALRERIRRSCKQERFVATAVLDCALDTLINKRPDYSTLKPHLEAILRHKEKYQHRISQAKKAKALGNSAGMHAVPAHRAKITEAIGERETTVWCVQNLPDYQIRSGFAAGIGIDQIWAKKDEFGNITHYAVVEAKGPGAKLSDNAAKGDQMSKQWVKASLEQAAVSSKTTDQEKADARAMLHAMAHGPPPYVNGYVIEAKPGGGAEQKGCPDKGIYHLLT